MRLRRPVSIAAVLSVALSSAGIVLAAGPVAAAPAVAPIVLSVVGDGSAALATAPTAVFLRTINSDGSDADTSDVALPTAASGADLPFALSGDSSAIGQLALAGDAGSLAIAGYAAIPGAPIGDPKDSTADVAPRIVASIDADGAVDTSTVLAGAYSQDHPRSVATADGQSFYVSGNGSKKTPAAGVVRAELGATTAPTAIAATPINARNLAISGGQLYSSSGAADRGVWTIGTGLPTTAATGTKIITAAAGTAASLFVLDTDQVAGADTAYVVMEDTGIAKWALSGSTWVSQGVAAGSFQAVTGRLVDGAVELFLVKGTAAGNSVVAVTDAAASVSPIALGTETTISVGAANTAIRGIALAPTAWNPPSTEAPAPIPTIAASPAAASAAVGSGDAALTTTVELGGVEGTDPSTFEVTATATTNADVAAIADVVITGTGSTRQVSVSPKSVGVASISLTVTDPAAETSAVATFTVGLSAATPDLDGVNYHFGSADASTAIALDDEYMLVADDETNVIRLYSRTETGPAIREFDFPELGSKEVDLEASARIGNTIYWFASHGNNKDSEYKEVRSVFFETSISGAGLDTELSYVGKYSGLRNDLLALDAENNNRLDLATACSLTVGTHPDTTTGCNIEGLEIAPDETTGFIGMRAPLVDGKAVIVPVTNFTSLVGAAATAKFSDPILVDLGGRTIREIRANRDGDYLITAGVPDDLDQSTGWALYRWNGEASSAPYLVTLLPNTTGDAVQHTGSYESIVEVPAPLEIGADIQLLTDNGTTVFYADGVEGKDVAAGLMKFRSNTITLGAGTISATKPVIAGVAAVGRTLSASASAWSPASVGISYQWTRNGTPIAGATSAKYKTTKADAGTRIAVRLTGSQNGFTTVTASSNNVIIAKLLTATPTPKISGTATKGSKLTAITGTWKPSGVTLRYQWFRDGAAISGASSKTYTVRSADKGHRINLMVTGSKSGYTSVSKISAAKKAR